jgi:hypothetical protein
VVKARPDLLRRFRPSSPLRRGAFDTGSSSRRMRLTSPSSSELEICYSTACPTVISRRCRCWRSPPWSSSWSGRGAAPVHGERPPRRTAKRRLAQNLLPAPKRLPAQSLPPHLPTNRDSMPHRQAAQQSPSAKNSSARNPRSTSLAPGPTPATCRQRCAAVFGNGTAAAARTWIRVEFAAEKRVASNFTTATPSRSAASRTSTTSSSIAGHTMRSVRSRTLGALTCNGRDRAGPQSVNPNADRLSRKWSILFEILRRPFHRAPSLLHGVAQE